MTDYGRFANPMGGVSAEMASGLSTEQYREAKKIVKRKTKRDTDVDARNKLASQVEVYSFVAHPPKTYFLYIKDNKATTWTGESLGDVSFGREFRTNMGDVRVPVTIHAINGRKYVGTYFKSAGDYARVRLAK